MGNLKFIATETLSRIADAIREKDPDLNNPQMTPVQMSHYIRILDPHGYKFDGGEGGIALNFGTNLRAKFQNNALRMYPVISNQVTDMQQAFNNCRNLAGSPMCNNNVVYGYQMYRDCWNLTGEPAFANQTQSLQNMCQSYYNCINITGNASVGPAVTDGSYAYYNCSNLNGHIDYIPSDNLANMAYMFWNCVNLHGEPIISNNTTSMVQAYFNCSNLTGNPVIDNTTTDMTSMYQGCSNLTGRPVCAPNTTLMNDAFAGCVNITGRAVMGSKVTTAYRAYQNCQHITDGIMGNLVTRMDNGFEDCWSLGRVYQSPNLQVALGVYKNCQNLTGSIIFGKEVTFFTECCYNCFKLQGAYIIGNSNTSASSYNLTRVANGFNRAAALEANIPLSRLNVVFSQRVTMNRWSANSVSGCDMTFEALEENNRTISLPLTYSNGMVYGYKNYTCLYHWYNNEHKLHYYSVN